jgi:sugar phosphate permease
MFKRIKISDVYFGWWITIAVSFFFSLTTGYGTQGASIIFKPLAEDLALNRAATSIAMGIGSLQNGIVFPLAGWLCDRYGSKYLAVAGCIITGTGLILLNFIHSAWQYYLVWGVLIAGGNTLGFSVSIDKVVTNWFVRKRGMAFSVRFAITAVVGMILLPVISLLVTSVGWRATALIWSAVTFATIPVAFIFVRQHRPEHYGLLPDGDKHSDPTLDDTKPSVTTTVAAGFEEEEFTLKQALKTPTYWMLTVIWILYFAVLGGLGIHLIPMLTDTGISLVKASSMVALMTLFSLPSRLLIGIVADRISKYRIQYLLGVMMTFMALGVWALLLDPSFHGRIYLFLVLYGIGAAAFVPMDIIIRSRFYGRKAYGSIQSTSMFFSAPVSFFAPILTGWVYDTYGSYTLAFTVFAIMITCAAVLTFLLRVPKLPAASN